jgi:hypothetical protein
MTGLLLDEMYPPSLAFQLGQSNTASGTTSLYGRQMGDSRRRAGPAHTSTTESSSSSSSPS